MCLQPSASVGASEKGKAVVRRGHKGGTAGHETELGRTPLRVWYVSDTPDNMADTRQSLGGAAK
jgi:hypothetical protein